MGLNISLAPETLFHIGTLPISNSFFWLMIVSVLLIILTFLFYRNLKMRPGGIQSFMEMLLEGAYGFVEETVGDKKKTKRVFPLVFTMFFFVLICNLLTFIPGQSAVTIQTADGIAPLFRSIIADYGLVFMMTMISVLITQIVAIAVAGPLGYIGRFLNFKSPLGFFLGIMDLIGELAKVMSLSFRLFGNMFAGEVLTAVMLFLAPFFLPLPFAFLGLLTAVVQPFVFAVLTLVFISMASTATEEAQA
ncbi:MAG: FoF1 ATP synthase subunit a [Patescibacteria group bacterium]|jgi:F-type H+-transporting ATPase subunit a|nr:FoF1 ATP synthase subunit a [Patescibacteria group bacterium]